MRRRFWTAAEDRCIHDHYSKRGSKYCSEVTGRSASAVRNRAALLRVKPATPRVVMAVEGVPCLTHREIGERLGLSGERVKQIERIALQKLRVLVSERGLTREEVTP